MAKDFRAAVSKNRNTVVDVESQPAPQQLKPYGENIRQLMEEQASQEPIHQIPISRLNDNPFQHLSRSEQDDEDIEDLANSIRTMGFYGALLARHKRGTTDDYELAYGHRRKKAALQAGLTTLPVKIIALSDTEMLTVMTSENLARRDLELLNQASVIGELARRENLSAREIAQRIGRKPGWVSLRLALDEAPLDIKDLVAQKPNTIGHVQMLLSISDPKQRAELISEVLSQDLSQTALRERIKSLKSPLPATTNSTQHTATTKKGETEIEKSHTAPAIASQQPNIETILATSTESYQDRQETRFGSAATSEVISSTGVSQDTDNPVISNNNVQESQQDQDAQRLVTSWRQHLQTITEDLVELENITTQLDKNSFQSNWLTDEDQRLLEQSIKRLQKMLARLK